MKDLGYLAQDISILHRQYYKDTNNQFNQIGLNPTAACILLTISNHDTINQSQIARQLVLDKGMVAREIKKLVDKDWVSKQSMPGKAMAIQLTSTGKQILKQAQVIRSNWWKERFEQTGIKQNSPIVASIQRVVDTIINPDSKKA